MKGWKRTLFLLGLTVLLFVSNLPAKAAGEAAPDFELADYQGRKHRLSEFRGKPVLINFWASWCTSCRLEAKDLADAAELYHDKVNVLGVNLADQDSQSVSEAFLKKFGIRYPNLLDEEGKVADQYHVLVIPTSILLDQNGNVVERVQGPLFHEEIDKLFQKVLK
jgi:peroxiredoxin